MGGEALKDIGVGILANVTQAQIDNAYQSVVARLQARMEATAEPVNHDLLQALRSAQLNALRFVVETIATDLDQ